MASAASFEAMVRLAPSEAFVSAEAAHLRDAWATSVFSGLCFEKRQRRWLLLVQQRASLPPVASFGSHAFVRYPLHMEIVPNRSRAYAHRSQRCMRPGVTFVADLAHRGATMGIAHFAKRILRLHGLRQRAAAYGLPHIDRVTFPATSAAHLAHSWPSSMLRIIHPNVATESFEALTANDCCYETVIASAKENTYFVRRQDADALRERAYALAGLPLARDACAPVAVCYFQRSEGKPGGRWEGGSRLIVNRRELLRQMRRAVDTLAPGGVVRIVNINSSHTFAQQVATFASCDLMASVHGSQNANLMFMRPGTAFMELNPYKFLYRSYEQLCEVCGILSLPSRLNSIAVESRAATRFKSEFGAFSDDACQQHRSCRSQSRNFPTLVNETDFVTQLARGLAHVTRNFPRPYDQCPQPTPAAVTTGVEEAAALMGDAAAAVVHVPPRGRSMRRVSGRALRGRGGAGRGAGRAGGQRVNGEEPWRRPIGADQGQRRRELLQSAKGREAVATAPSGGGGLRIAICISGQLSRLEINSKVENVLKPTAASSPPPAALDVFLALEVGKTLYSNLDFGAILAQQHNQCGAKAVSQQMATEQFSPWLAAAHFSNHTTRHIELLNWGRYRRDRPRVERQTRLQHHLSQFAHMRTCAQLMSEREVATRAHYDVVLKMRDNTVAVSPFVISARYATGRALTKRCVEWGGYNDKAMIMPRRYMEGAMRGPSEDFYLANGIGRGIPNSERLLRAVFERNGVRVERVEAAQLPLVDARCSPFGWCLVEEGKDCRPTSWTWNTKPCEQLNVSDSTRQLYANRFKPRAEIREHMRSTVGEAMNEA